MASSGIKKEESTTKPGEEEFGYLPPPRELLYREEGVKEKLLRKTKENPFVPIGKEFKSSDLRTRP